jgi:Na+/H+ antiporter NhaC
VHRSLCFLLVLSVVLIPERLAAQETLQLKVESEQKVLHGRAVDCALVLRDAHARPLTETDVVLRPARAWRDSSGIAVQSLRLRTDAEGRIPLTGYRVPAGAGAFRVEVEGGASVRGALGAVAQFWVIVPPVLAILLALLFRQVILALVAGIWVGAWILAGDPVSGVLRTLDRFVVGALSDSFQATIVLFTASMGGMVGVVARSGGSLGVVEAVSRWIRGPRSAQVVTWFMGLAIFFDDYTNTLVVGNTMRPITDRLRISREKLAYIVDSTAAPVTTVALVSTWVGYQVSLIRDGLAEVGEDPASAYGTFIASIPYSTYAWLALALVFIVAVSGRDFGPMQRAERRCRRTGALTRDGAQPLMDEVGQDMVPPEGVRGRAHRAVLPVAVLLLACLGGLFWDGRQALLDSVGPAGLAGLPVRDFFSHADPARALFWGAIAGSAVAVILAVAGRVLTVLEAMEAWVSGCKAMMTALIILVLAWSIKDVCSALGTGPVVVDWTTGNLSPFLLPTVAFVLAAFIAFSTGTSWAAMAILMPIVIPLGHDLPAAAAMEPGHAQGVLLASIAAVLSGAVWGDHCSPISDTTIMSSMASGSDHVDHVRTQLPYALTSGGLAVALGTLPAGLGMSPWISLSAGVLVLIVLVGFLGRTSDEERG